MASRDEILAFAAEYLELDAYPDYGPMGLQVLGAEDVTKIACGVSASRGLFVAAGEAGAQLVLVHHGLLWDKESRIVDRVLRGRLKALFDFDLTLAGYHLALDAHPDIGNNALLAAELGVETERRFTPWGYGGKLAAPVPMSDFSAQGQGKIDRRPPAFFPAPCGQERA